MIYLLSLSEKDFGMLEPFFAEFLPKKSLEKKASLKLEKALISLTAELFLRLYIADKYGISSSEITFFHTKNGKPYLKTPKSFYFNLSHSENTAAVAISDCEIGVDIEKLRKFNPKTAERFFSADELNYIFSGERDIRFTEIWTKKEAFIKLNSLNLSHLKGAKTENIFTTKIDDFILSYCDEKQNLHTIKKIYLTDILKLLEKVKNI